MKITYILSYADIQLCGKGIWYKKLQEEIEKIYPKIRFYVTDVFRSEILEYIGYKITADFNFPNQQLEWDF